MHLKGVWISFARAKQLAEQNGIADALYPLFEPNIRSSTTPTTTPEPRLSLPLRKSDRPSASVVLVCQAQVPTAPHKRHR